MTIWAQRMLNANLTLCDAKQGRISIVYVLIICAMLTGIGLLLSHVFDRLFPGLLKTHRLKLVHRELWSESYLHTISRPSVSLTVKGTEHEVNKILHIYTAIDLSCNKFWGEISEVTGELKWLALLNLSHNDLTRHLPAARR